MLHPKLRFNRYVILIGSLTAVTLLTALGGMLEYSHELDSQLVSAKNTPIIKTIAAPSPNKTGTTNSVGNSNSAGSIPGKSITSQQLITRPNQQLPAQPSQYSSPTSATTSTQPSTVQVTLDINGKTKGVVSLPITSNQCDLLSQAYNQGILGELDMRYSSQFGTEGIYSIDGMGDPNSIWWTYTVNGKAPPFGCAYVKVQNGETVNWQYVKN
ncbi:MAG: DUF4430 domain-containing protein [Candidatus Saccharimonadales bacterium]